MLELKFLQSCAQLHQQRIEIVKAKRPEYTEGDADVLRNFKQVAVELGITPTQAWYVYFRKHISSIATYARTGTAPAEPIQTRICDAMNYLELLNALINDSPQSNENTTIQSPTTFQQGKTSLADTTS